MKCLIQIIVILISITTVPTQELKINYRPLYTPDSQIEHRLKQFNLTMLSILIVKNSRVSFYEGSFNMTASASAVFSRKTLSAQEQENTVIDPFANHRFINRNRNFKKVFLVGFLGSLSFSLMGALIGSNINSKCHGSPDVFQTCGNGEMLWPGRR